MERRKLNLNSIIGMDIRDFNVEQQKVKELINLTKDKDGWKVRDDYKSILTGLTDSQEVKDIFVNQNNNTALIQIDKVIYIYSINNYVLTDLLDSYTFTYDFKLWNTNYPNVYFQIDTTNKISYVLEFTERVLSLINDSGNLELSTEYALNEYDSTTGDLTWSAFCKHNPYTSASYVSGTGSISVSGTTVTLTGDGKQLSIGNLIKDSAGTSKTIVSISYTNDTSASITVDSAGLATGTGTFTYSPSLNSKTYANSINKYMVNWDMNNYGLSTEWSEVSLLNKISSDRESQYYIVEGIGVTTNIKSMTNNDKQPEKYITLETKSDKNLFKVDGTGSVNSNARFMAIAPEYLYSSTNKFTETYVSTDAISSSIYKTVGGILYNGNKYVFINKKLYIVSDYGVVLIPEIPIVPNRELTKNHAVGYYNDYLYYLGQNVDNINQPTYVFKATANSSGGASDPIIDIPVPRNTITGFYIKDESKIFIFSTMNSLLASVNTMFVRNGSGWDEYTTEGAKIYDAYYYDASNIYLVGEKGSGTSVLKIFNGSSVSSLGTSTQTVATKINYVSSTEIYTSDYPSTGLGTIYLYNGSTHTLYTSLAMSDFISKTDYYQVNELYPTTKVLKYYNGTITNISDTISNTVYCIGLNSAKSKLYGLSSNGSNLYLIEFETKLANTSTYNIYSPNDDAIAKLTNIGGSLTYTSGYIDDSSTATVKSVHEALATWYDGEYASYLVTFSDYLIKVYLVDKTLNSFYEKGSVTIGSISSPFLSSGDIVGAPVYTSRTFNGSCITRNKYYETNNGSLIGFNIFIFTSDNVSTYCDVYLLLCGNTFTAKLSLISQGTQIPNSSDGYLSTNQCFINTIKYQYITSNNNYHYIYATLNNRMIKYRITGNQMITDDINSIEILTPSEISRYADPEGNFCGHILTNTEGYVLTEINKSKKIPIRPYFLNTNSTLNTLYTATLTYTDRLDSTVTRTFQNMELFNIFEQIDRNNGSFRTGISIGNGSQLLCYDDSSANVFLFWIFAILESGIYDNALPYINIGRGILNSTTNTYDFAYWGQNQNFLSDVYPEANTDNVFQLPHRFYNIDVFKNNDNNFLVNGKIFFQYGFNSDLGYSDSFYAKNYYSTDKSILFEIQDLIFSSAELMFALDYDSKSVYFSTGFKYINKNNSMQMLSKPVGIQEINDNNFIIVCENDVYQGNGISEGTASLMYITSNIGLEKDNYKSLVCNGMDSFFYNKKGLWMVRQGQVINIGLPIEDYLYKNSYGNKLGLDTYNNLLYIPIDYTKMQELKTVLKTNDYGVITDTTKEYNKCFALFNYQDLYYKIYAYVDDSTVEPIDFFGSILDYPIVRVGTKLIIPEYKVADGTENPLCRIRTKRMSFGNVFGLKKLDTILYYLINNNNWSDTQYGFDHFKLNIILDKGTYTWSTKYGDYRSSSYSDSTPDYIVPSSTTVGFTKAKIPLGLDFHDIEIVFEYARLLDTNKANTTINELDFDVIQKDSEINGII